MNITIPQTVIDNMLSHARDLLPNESCGYLAGIDGAVNKLIKMTNIDNLPDHFTFEPREQFEAVKEARNEGLQLISVYHSHPTSPARPSQEDLKLLKDPNIIYVIVSLETDSGDIKAYRISGEEKMDEVDIIIQ